LALPYVIARSPDGRLLAAGAEDGSVSIWDLAGRRRRARLFVSEKARVYAQTLELARSLWTNSNPDFDKKTEAIASLAFSPDGRFLAMAGNRGSLHVWETDGWKECGYWQGDVHGSPWIAFIPDSGGVVGSRGGQVCVWEADTGEVRTTLGAEADSPILCGAFLPGKEVIALGSKDGVIRLWNPHSGEVKRLPAGHQDRVTSLAFAPDGKTLASVSWDRTVRLWNLRANREVATLEGHKGRINAVAFSPDGKTLASGGEAGAHCGEVLLWRR
jgi:WD40 repeat protein